MGFVPMPLEGRRQESTPAGRAGGLLVTSYSKALGEHQCPADIPSNTLAQEVSSSALGGCRPSAGLEVGDPTSETMTLSQNSNSFQNSKPGSVKLATSATQCCTTASYRVSGGMGFALRALDKAGV